MISKIFLALLGMISINGNASDHIDGPVTTKHRVGDLTDFFAFPSPEKSGHLTLILNTYPLVSPSGHFSDKVDYNFIIRKASIDQKSNPWRFATSDEVTIRCHIDTPNDINKHVITCKSTNGLVASNLYGVLKTNVPGNDFDLFAGMRSDPFFFNAIFATTLADKGIKVPFTHKNIMDKVNALSIAITIDPKVLFKGFNPSLLALATESVTPDSSAPGGMRTLDRLGRAEITNITFAARGREDIRDEFNSQRPFQVSKTLMQKHQQRIYENISFWDKVDEAQDWTNDGKNAFSTILADDFLVLDLSKPCNGNSFLHIEKAMAQKTLHATCGGRKILDDFIDNLFSVYVGGFTGKVTSDGVDGPYKQPLNTFPYLAEPEIGLSSRLKLAIAKVALGLKED